MKNHKYIPYNFKLKNIARDLRKNMTDTEKDVWEYLKIHFSEYTWNRQKPLDNFIADFYCSELSLILEIDGEIHEKQLEKDGERDRIFSQKYNITTIRFKNSEIQKDVNIISSRLAGKFPFLIKKAKHEQFHVLGDDFIKENKEVTNNSTFRIKTIAQYYCEVENLEDLKFALNFAKEKKVNWCVLGDGSNTIFANENLNYLIIKNKILGIEKLDFEIYKVGAGENWDNFVRFISKQNLYGIEMLAYIPGTVGAAPVQNIAAYGGQVSDTILEIEVYNIQTEKVEILKNEECNFVYRGSRFKKEKYFIILNVTFKFSKKPLKNIYKEIEIYLTTNGKQKNLAGQFFKIEGEEKQEEIKFTANQITEAVTNIRKTKLPEVEETSNVGSFFQNPIIEKEKLAKILEKFPNVIFHEVDKEKVKLGAGRLSEILGFKGFVFKNFGVHKDHAIILIHLGNGKADDLFELIKIIQNKVKENFDIDFEIEPNFLIN